ncbi:MAG: LuxR C-terminal-related transcriptional regulator [Acidimicrobiales bacterium]
MGGSLRGREGGESNLPVALTTLVVRKRELSALGRLLAATRLVTLVGTGGVGKTRLALAVAERSRGRFADGECWVDLTAVSGSGPVAPAVAVALRLPQAPGQDVVATLADYFDQRAALLVLDNCEQVVEECACLVGSLLGASPGLRVLATSREVLGVPAEAVFRVGGLHLPAEEAGRVGGEAVQLFVERARAVAPDLVQDQQLLRSVARLCRQLDGLPLAIELAAARVGLLSVAEIADRLEPDSSLLRHPGRAAAPRHRTLQATFDWSYRLLSPDEQVLFRRLSVFQPSFSLVATEAIGTRGQILHKDVVDLLAGLVDKSLVQVTGRGSEYRYALLATVRQYGQEKLAASGEAEVVRQAHARFYTDLAEQAKAGLDGPDQAHWLERLEIEHDNLREALQALSQAPEEAGHLTATLWPFWYLRGHYHEARAWLERAISLADRMSPAVRAETLMGAGVLAFLQCDYELAAHRLSSARSLFQQEGDRAGVAASLQRLGSIAREQARYGDARRLHEASRAIWAELGDPAGVARSESYLGFVAWLEGDFGRALPLCARAVSYFRGAGRRQETAAALVNLGMASWHRGDEAPGLSLLEEALAISRDIGYLEGVAWALHGLGTITWPRRPDAAAWLAEALSTHLHLGDRWRVASVLETIAGAVLAGRDPEEAARLLGAAEALREALGTPLPLAERPDHDRAVSALRGSLGDGFAPAWARGRATALDQAVETASQLLAGPAPGPPVPCTDVVGYGLTEREQEVLRLVTKGLTNREIGRQLHISSGTAGVHVSNILRKLAVRSRVQAAGVGHRLGLG